MQKTVVPIVTVICLGFLGFVFYLFSTDSGKPQQAGVNSTASERPAQSAVPGPQVGEAAPDISGVDIDGKEFKLSDYRGKVVLLDFWGFW